MVHTENGKDYIRLKRLQFKMKIDDGRFKISSLSNANDGGASSPLFTEVCMIQGALVIKFSANKYLKKKFLSGLQTNCRKGRAACMQMTRPSKTRKMVWHYRNGIYKFFASETAVLLVYANL